MKKTVLWTVFSFDRNSYAVRTRSVGDKKQRFRNRNAVEKIS